MKKLFHLTVLLLSTYLLVSCAGTAPKLVEPGGNIGEMTVENHVTNRNFPSIWGYCPVNVGEEPGSTTVDCELPRISGVAIDFGWEAKDETFLESNLEIMKWEMYVDGQQINVDAFESSRTNRSIGPGISWIIELVNLTPGQHTLRLLYKSEETIDDGFGTYPAGAYEALVNFTVPEQ